jgi:geranylgeranyl diphosphate synthase type I
MSLGAPAPRGAAEAAALPSSGADHRGQAGGAAAPRSVTREFDRARRLIEPPIRSRVDALAPDLRLVVGYHFGFLDGDGAPSSEVAWGKALRPALALLSAEAAGAPSETGVPGAVAIQLVHNFSLVHDDVMDGDRTRRHRPTAWSVFGVPRAIIAGDVMLSMAYDALLESDGERDRSGSSALRPSPSARAVSMLNGATATMIAGQSRDLALAARRDVTLDEAVQMATQKTGALLSCASAIGAALASAPDGVVTSLSSFGLHVGVAFQAVDDLLGIWGRPEVTGKPAASDLRERKKSIPVVAALSSGTPAGDELRDLQPDPSVPLTEEQIERAARLVDEAGGRRWAQAEADRRIEQAAAALDAGDVEPDARGRLLEIAAFVTRRDT